MKVIIAGSRTIGGNRQDTEKIQQAMRDAPFNITELVHGGAKGVDTTAANLYAEHNKDPEIKMFEADWETHGKAAGPIRNQKMADYADALIAVWNRQSKGTRNMINEAVNKNLDTYITVINK